MFRNRWGALFFAVMTAAGAAALVGGEQEQGVLLDAAEDIQQQKAAMEATMAGVSAPPAAITTSGEVEFIYDEDLIDDAAGFDPTPAEDAAPLPGEVVPYDEIVIVSRDVGAPGQ